MSNQHVINLTKATFDETIMSADKPVLVDFWAAWCGPCRSLAPVIDDVAAQTAGRAVVCKLDVDAEGAIAAQYGVMSIPTVVIFQKGEEVRRFVGLQTKETLLGAL